MGESRTPVVTRRFRVAGLGDADAALRVEHALLSVPGVHRAICDFEQQQVIVRVAEYVADEALVESVEGVGFTLVRDQQPSASSGEHLAAPRAAPKATTEPQVSSQPDSTPPPKPEPEVQTPTREDQVLTAASWWESAWYFGSRAALYGLVGSLVLTILYRFVPVPTTLLMISEGVLGGTPIRHDWVSLSEISPNLVRSVIASEDNDFCSHWGFDFKEMQDAWHDARRGGKLRGASTISQQTAKNVFLWPGRSWFRKGFEAYFTVAIETFWPKSRIMEVYLNVIEWGPGVFGAEEASQKWFGKHASRLTAIEAARLAAILPNPIRYKANPPGPYVNGRSYTISARAYNVSLYGEDRCTRP